MSNFYLVCGMSGSGKTTFVNEIRDKNPNLIYFDIDQIYAEVNGNECIHTNFFEVWMKLWQRLHDAEITNKDCLLETNSLTVAQRNQFVEWFPTFKHHLIWIDTPIDLCYKNNNNRNRKIPKEKMDAMVNKMEYPQTHEPHWESITKIVNHKNDMNWIVRKIYGNMTLNF